MAGIPESLTRFLKSQFPTLPIRQTWLAECVEYLQSEEGIQSSDELNTQTMNQILMANLEDVASRSVLPDDIQNLRKGTIGSLTNPNRTSVLVQIVGISDIGISAQNQIQVLEARKAVKASPGMAALLNNDSATVDADPSQTQAGDDHMRAFGEQESEIQKSSTVFSRSMLQVFVTDGHSEPIPAFEKTRIPGLDLATTPLGCKLLLKGAQVKRGQILLEPKVVVIKGGSIPELMEEADLTMMNLLRRRIGQDPLTAEAPRPQANQDLAAVEFHVDSDEEAALLEMQEQEIRSSNPRRNTSNNVEPRNANQNQSGNSTGGNARAENATPNQARNQTPDFDEDEDELFAMIDENEGKMVGGSRSQNQGNGANGNSGSRNESGTGWSGNNEVIDLSDSP